MRKPVDIAGNDQIHTSLLKQQHGISDLNDTSLPNLNSQSCYPVGAELRKRISSKQQVYYFTFFLMLNIVINNQLS